MGLYYNGKKVRNLYFNGKCITRLALGKEMTRLVEGEDFVRAEWLKGDGFARIDTNILFESSDNILTRINITELPTNSSYFFIYGDDSSNYDYTLMAVLFSNSYVEFRPQRASANLPMGSYEIHHNLDGVSINGKKVIDLHKDYVYVNKSIYIFTSHYLGGARINFPGDIAYFRITDPTFTIDRVNMTPCRLLRPIPATLDANGIARNAGDCGMYNSVNGLFYGNVASSGSFTVSDN